MEWVRMKKSRKNWIIVLSIVLLLYVVNIADAPKYLETPGDPSENIINSKSEQIDDFYFTPEDDTHYDNYTVIMDWYFGPYRSFEDFVLINNIIFAATDHGLCIFNSTDLSNNVLISQSFPSKDFSEIKIVNDLAYLISGHYYGFTIVNVSDLLNPVFVNEIIFNDIRTFEVDEDLVFISTANEIYGLQIYNFSDPVNPVLIGEYEIYDFSFYFKTNLQGDYLYCLSNHEALAIIDVSDLENPTLVVTQDLVFDYDDLIINGSYLYLLDREYLQIWDVSNVYSIFLCDYLALDRAEGFYIFNNFAFILESGTTTELKIYDVSDSYNISLVATHVGLFPRYVYNGKFQIEEDICYTSIEDDGFVILNISDYQNITKISHDFNARVMGVHIIDDCAFVEFYDRGFKIYNISDFRNPTHINSVYINDFEKHMILIDDLCYCYSSTYLYIYNISDVNQLQLISETNLGGINKLIVQANHAYIIRFDDLLILDLTDPTNPTVIYTISDLYYPEDLIVFNDLLIFARNDYTTSYFKIMNISNPQSPTLIKEFEIAYEPYLLRTNGTFLYIAEGSPYNLYTYNITDAANPIQVSNINLQVSVNEFFLYNNSLYLFSRQNGLEIRETNAQGNLTLSGRLSPYWSSYNLFFKGAHALKDNLIFMEAGYRILIIGLDSDNDSIADYMETTVYGTDPFDVDSDDDLMHDNYEIKFNLDPLNSTDATLDFDGDTLTNFDESLINTDPWSNDTDSDFLTDNLELVYNTNPLDDDTDSDILLDFEEIFTYFTDPLLDDSDNDTLEDGAEVHQHLTDPLNNDTDGDLMDDGFEVRYRLDPFSDDRALDLDFDGLTNYEEYLLGTRPNRSDSDMDGFTDLEELEAGTDPLDGLSHPEYPPSFTSTAPLACYWCFILAFLFFSSLITRSKITNRKRRGT